MEKLEFHKDKNFFMDWLNMNAMSTGEIALWHTLMNVGNRLGQRSKFNAPTSTLSKYTGLSKQGLINARKRLMERGFIKFEKGTKYQAPVYQMLPIHKLKTNYYHFSTDGNLTQDLTQDLPQDFNIHKDLRTKDSNRNSCSARDAQENLIISTYESNIGKLAPLIKEDLLQWMDTFNEKIITQAIREMVKRGGKTYSYLEKILQHWQSEGLNTLEEILQHELDKELAKKRKVIKFPKKEKEDAFELIDLKDEDFMF